jgi:hypothetical protein
MACRHQSALIESMGKAARRAREQKMGCDRRPLKMTPSDRRSLAHLDKTCPGYNKAPNSTYEEFMHHMGSGGGFDGHVWCQKGGEIADPTPLDDEMHKKQAVCYGDRVYHQAPGDVQAAVWLGLLGGDLVAKGQLVEFYDRPKPQKCFLNAYAYVHHHPGWSIRIGSLGWKRKDGSCYWISG